MKKIIIIISILAVSLNNIAQEYNPYRTNQVKQEWKHKEAVKTIAVYSSSIILSAVSDGLNDGIIGDKSYKTLGHALNAASVGILLASPFILKADRHNWGWYAASYISLRIALFDMTYNTTRGLPMQYVGNSSLYDKTLAATKSPDSWLFAGRSLFFIVGISIPIKEL